jgi:ABC-type multidrug transport system fused ATPase/permease subunit
VFAHESTIGEVPRFIAYYLLLFRYFMGILFKYLSAQGLAPRLTDLKKIWDLAPTVVDTPHAISFPGLKEGFILEDVTFTYPMFEEELGKSKVGDRGPVLENVRLVIPKGQITVITGETGSGKSTLANLLNRLHDPTGGFVLADGVDIRNYTLESYHRAFTNLSQDAHLYNDSIEYSIQYSRIGSSRESVVEAAKTARIHEFISRLPRGYQTMLNERGANISGGEKQRIALARAALAKDAEVVILDEPTNNLDNRTASEFLDKLFEIFAGKTIIIIAHAQAVMRRADQVVFLEKGRIVRIGPHEDLFESCESYKNLVLTV